MPADGARRASAHNAAGALADSVGMVRAARDAQARFESFRQLRLPQARGLDGQCDVQVGRFCYYYEEPAERPSGEPPEIRVARDTLLADLGRAAARVGGDGWIAGQRIRYLLEAGRASDAVAVAAACRSAEAGWCSSLAGLALHAAGAIAAAESAFAAAVRALPDDRRCAWLDLSPVLDYKLRAQNRRAKCGERPALNERLWWLARPFFSTDANDLRTEHFARLTMARLYDSGRTPYHPNWGSDSREVLVRYGWPTLWSRDHLAEGRTSGSGTPRVIGYEPSPSYYFFPSADAAEQPTDAEGSDWDLRAPAARSRYAPPYAKRVTGVEFQSALFRRGDSTLAVAAYDLLAPTGRRRGETPPTGAAHVALVLARDEHTAPVVARQVAAPARGTLSATAPWRPVLVGVEALASHGSWGARGRSGAGSPGAENAPLAVSDILLLEAGGEPAPSLTEALPRARPSLRVRRGETIGLFWEVYGLAGHTEEVTVTLAVTRERVSWGRRRAEALRLVRRPSPVRLRWAVRPDDPRQAVGAGGVTLGLAGLSPGPHRVELSVRTAAGESAVAVRRITIER